MHATGYGYNELATKDLAERGSSVVELFGPSIVCVLCTACCRNNLKERVTMSNLLFSKLNFFKLAKCMCKLNYTTDRY